MNCESEIEILRADNYAGIAFIETEKTIEYYTGKKLISINAMIDVARNRGQDLILINSDIILLDLPKLKHDGITIFSRYDYNDFYTRGDSIMFKHGFDCFFIPRQFFKFFPPSIYGMGAAYWDYWIPFHCILNDIPIYYPPGKFAFHKVHSTQYSMDEWYYIGEHFRWEFKFDKKLTIEQVTAQSLATIKSHLTT